MRNPIVQEVRRARNAHAKQFNYDLDAIFEDLKKRETAAKKRVRVCPRGRKYIVSGENWHPGIAPRRIIIGTKADRTIDSISANYSALPENDAIFSYSPMPEVAYADMPIA